MDYHPDPITVLLASVFMICYVAHLFRKTISEKVDLYDFILLSTVALAPSALLYFPHLSMRLSKAAGVAFPFVLMFGFLFLIVFVFLHRFVAMGKSNERRITTLVQELAILKASLKNRPDLKPHTSKEESSSKTVAHNH